MKAFTKKADIIEDTFAWFKILRRYFTVEELSVGQIVHLVGKVHNASNK
jgi:hypothetical protein